MYEPSIPITLDDCGKEFNLDGTDVTLQMAIKAPRGMMILWKSYNDRFNRESTKCQAIKYFMKEHRDD